MRTILTLLALLSLIPGCKGEPKEEPTAAEPNAAAEPAAKAEAANAEATAPAKYSVRGQVKGIDAAAGQVAIHHENIPDFVNRQGEKVGMMAMQMSFRLGKGVDPASLAEGDKIAFDFVVDWEQSPPIEVVSVSKLPPETELSL